MRDPIRDKGRLKHIVTAINNVQRFLSEKTFEDFRNDDILYFAVVKNIEIIGEAAYMLTSDFRDTHTSVPWQKVIAMRHILVHGYYQISAELVWDVTFSDLVELKVQVETFLKE